MAQVSVVIPVYNIVLHLRQCLDSICSQTLEDLEIICVDDGSTDGSLDILREYEKKDSRFRVLTQANAGPGAARNNGLTYATGEYLIFLDSDDWFEPDFLSSMTDRARSCGADVTVCRSVSFDSASGQELPSEWMLNTDCIPDDTFAPEECAGHILQFAHGWPWDKLYRRDFVLKHGFQFPSLRNSQDLVFVFPSLLRAEKITVVEQTLIHHRFNRKTSVSNTRIEHLHAPYEAVCMLKSYMDEHGLWETYENSYLNWVAGFLIWHVSSLAPGDMRKRAVACLRDQWFPALGIAQKPVARFEEKRTRAKLLLVRHAPYWAFSLAVSGHNRIKALRQAKNA